MRLRVLRVSVSDGTRRCQRKQPDKFLRENYIGFCLFWQERGQNNPYRRKYAGIVCNLSGFFFF